MEQNKTLHLQQIAEKALSDSVVRLELWSPVSYHDYVIAFDVDNPTQYPETESLDQPSNKTKRVIEEHLQYASGFFVEKHIIVTSFHAVPGIASIHSEFVEKEKKYRIDSVEAYDVENDLILLKVDGEGVPLRLGDSSKIDPEDDICAVGYPDGDAAIIHGAIDGIRIRDGRIRMRIETTKGSSGCPILDAQGNTIGVDASGDEVYSYAIPSKTLTELINKVRESIPLKEWQKLPCIRALTETEEGDRLQDKEDYRKAIAHYDTAINLKPDMVKAYNRRADAKMELCAFGTAIKDILTSKRLQPVQLRFDNITKYISWKMGWCKTIGIHIFIKLLRFMFGNCGWFRFKAHVKAGFASGAEKRGNNSKARRFYREAIFDFTVAISLKKTVAESYNSRGWIKYLLGKLETDENNKSEAQKLYKAATIDADTALQLQTKISKKMARYFHTRGAARAGIGDHQEAIEDFNECIRLKPKKALFYHDRGVSNEALGQHEAAEADFAKAKELDTDSKGIFKRNKNKSK